MTSDAYAEEKVPGGKLARVTVRADGGVEITGDFFAYPEEGIALIENALAGLEQTVPAAEIERRLNRTIDEAGVELIGLDVPAIVRLYMGCRSCGE
ncbi:MAG: hypothetical protein A4E28_00615 [Methanocella sp. PtaU1.Bin125]|nr:MAG: hypothetical protein A4E28_00615 [Methanocella sp. PtaU1.Bin125]